MMRCEPATMTPADPAAPPTDPRSYLVAVGADRLPLAEFLRDCLHQADEPQVPGSAAHELAVLRELFLEAGVRALEQRVTCAAGWLQVDVRPPARGFGDELHARLGELVRCLLDDESIHDFFFMDKPPGLRLRFRARRGGGEAIAALLHDQLEGWQTAGLIGGAWSAPYEPETQLFGGPASMCHVHALFTHDSLAWLDHLAGSGPDPAAAAPTWVLSLAMLRELFPALGIEDWEDLDVWDRVRRRTGRSLPGELTAAAGLTDAVAEVTREIRAHWTQPFRLMEQLPAASSGILESFVAAIAPIAASWQREYLPRPDACLGRRGLAALYTIFHWNRAGLSLTRQALLAEALATRETI